MYVSNDSYWSEMEVDVLALSSWMIVADNCESDDITDKYLVFVTNFISLSQMTGDFCVNTSNDILNWGTPSRSIASGREHYSLYAVGFKSHVWI
jgi:hypothetical protein